MYKLISSKNTHLQNSIITNSHLKILTVNKSTSKSYILCNYVHDVENPKLLIQSWRLKLNFDT